MYCHLEMIAVFVVGGILATVLCRYFQGRAIWAALIPLTILLVDLTHADLAQSREADNR